MDEQAIKFLDVVSTLDTVENISSTAETHSNHYRNYHLSKIIQKQEKSILKGEFYSTLYILAHIDPEMISEHLMPLMVSKLIQSSESERNDFMHAAIIGL